MAHGLTRLAGIWCNDPEFREWVALGRPNAITPAEAANWIRVVCQVESRRELDTDPEAAARFNEHVRGPFMEHREALNTF
jgi:hypothetical protein